MEDVPESEAVSFNPGFNFYSPCRCVDIAAEVTDEQEPSETSTDSDDYNEFSFVCSEGQIHQIFPIFNRDTLERTDRDKAIRSRLNSLRDLSWRNLLPMTVAKDVILRRFHLRWIN